MSFEVSPITQTEGHYYTEPNERLGWVGFARIGIGNPVVFRTVPDRLPTLFTFFTLPLDHRTLDHFTLEDSNN
jgi:hypothetical protein